MDKVDPDPLLDWMYQLTINQQAQFLLICIVISPQKQLKTSVNYAWELKVSAMLDLFFTELSLDLCSREEILNVEMELEADQFMVANSTMKISSKNMTNQVLYAPHYNPILI